MLRSRVAQVLVQPEMKLAIVLVVLNGIGVLGNFGLPGFCIIGFCLSAILLDQALRGDGV
jgi:hypothetical protein